MHYILALCITVLYEAAPLSCRSVEAPRDRFADLLIPLLDKTLEEKRITTHDKVIRVLPYDDSSERASKGWKKVRNDKRQLVEITPLRRRKGDTTKHLAYILSTATAIKDTEEKDASSGENSFEDIMEFEDDHSKFVDVAISEIPSEADDSSSEQNTALPDKDSTNDKYSTTRAVIPELDKFDQAMDTEESQEDDRKGLLISDETTDEDKIQGTGEFKNILQGAFAETSNKDSTEGIDTYDLQFGPGNNIIFDRGSSESLIKEVAEKNDGLIRSVNTYEGFDELTSADDSAVISEEDGEQQHLKGHAFFEPAPTMITELRTEARNANDLTYDNHNDSLMDAGTLQADDLLIKKGHSRNVIAASSPHLDLEEAGALEPVQYGRESKPDCDTVHMSRMKHSREHKSYRLSFLFNK